ncbi:MAG: hypothetical protein DWQ01_10835 [Planctomycetota bacterium]|nr:MAG: hypothetical protein DWQ01_10835 [Planctomycetota bacterium]
MTRLAIVGIDGATYEIIRPMIEEGELPHIARILKQGVSGDLESEKPPITPPAWTSMMTGINPGRHGIFHFIRREKGSYDCKLVDSRNFAGKDIMSLLTRRNWSVGSLSVPMTYPPFPVKDGYMVSGIPMPLEGDTIAWPSGTMQEMGEFLGHPYKPDVNYAPYDGDTEKPEDDFEAYERLRKELFAVEEDRLAILKEWMRRKPTDFFFTVVSVTDRCQHYFWKFQDPTHDGYTEEGHRRFGEVIKDSYRLADDFVGAVREIVGEDVPVALVSDHGFGPQYTDFHLNMWLEENGYLVRKTPPYFTWGKTYLADALRRAGLGFLAKIIGPLGKMPVVRPKVKRHADMRDVIWSKTKAFSAMHGICLNIRGREPEGIVDPGEEARRLLVEMEEKLHQLHTPDGKPAVDFCAKATDMYTGPHIPSAPDLQFMMQGLSCLPKEGWDLPTMFVRRKNAAISGQHRFNGIFALEGPGVAAGRILEDMHIQDTTPTLLASVGEAVPSWMEGSVHPGVFAEPAEVAMVEEDEPAVGAMSADAFSDEQTAAIEESLRGLGYLQ